MKNNIFYFITVATLLHNWHNVQGHEIHISEDQTIARVSKYNSNGDEDIQLEGNFLNVKALNFRANSCNIKLFPKNLFEKFPVLETLLMNAVHLERIPEGVFQHGENIKNLYLERNRLTLLVKGTFTGAESLESLKLSKNNISVIESGSFDGLPNLKSLELNRNDIKILKPDTLRDLQSLETIDLSFNQIEKIPNQIFASCTHLKMVKLFKNKLKTFDINLPSDLNFCYLNVDNNSINYFSLTFNQLNEVTETDDCTSHGIHAAHNLIESFYVPKESMAVNLIAVNGNLLNDIGNITKISGLKKLDISGNSGIETLTVLKDAKNLQALSLSNMGLTQLDRDIFVHLNSLTELDLSKNLLENLDFDAFANGLTEFYKLQLQNNKLKEFDVQKLLEKFPNITYLNIKNNDLTESQVNEIVSVLNDKNVTVIH